MNEYKANVISSWLDGVVHKLNVQHERVYLVVQLSALSLWPSVDLVVPYFLPPIWSDFLYVMSSKRYYVEPVPDATKSLIFRP